MIYSRDLLYDSKGMIVRITPLLSIRDARPPTLRQSPLFHNSVQGLFQLVGLSCICTLLPIVPPAVVKDQLCVRKEGVDGFVVVVFEFVFHRLEVWSLALANEADVCATQDEQISEGHSMLWGISNIIA